MIYAPSKLFHCPSCAHAQSSFALLTTYRGVLQLPGNASLSCPNCAASLVLRAKSTVGTVFLAGLAASLFCIGCFLIFTHLFGLAGVLILVILQLFCLRPVARLFYQTLYKVVRV